MKARSRLRSSAFTPTPVAPVTKPTPVVSGPARSRLTVTHAPRAHFPKLSPSARRQLRHHSQQLFHQLSAWAQQGIGVIFQWLLKLGQSYAPYFLFLVAALPGYASTLYILFRISPSYFQSWLITNSYILPQLIFFLSNYFFFTFLFQNYRRAAIAATFIQLLLLLKLQQFDLEWWLPVVFLVLFGILEVLWFGLCKLRPTLSPARKKRR